MPLLRLLRRFSRSLGSSGHLALSPMKGHVTATGSGGCTQGTQQNMTTLLASSDSYLAHASPTSGMLVVEVAEALGASERVMAFLDAKPAPQVLVYSSSESEAVRASTCLRECVQVVRTVPNE
eukprot:1136240-Pelagomonas_calceolata.AAC.7